MGVRSVSRISHSNASVLDVLLYGFLISNTVHILALYFTPPKYSLFPWGYYLFSSSIALGIWTLIVGLAKEGEDLASVSSSSTGMVGCMFDFVYFTWIVHVGTALVSPKFWSLYLVIPAYHLLILVRTCLGSLLRSIFISPPIAHLDTYEEIEQASSESASIAEEPIEFPAPPSTSSESKKTTSVEPSGVSSPIQNPKKNETRIRRRR